MNKVTLAFAAATAGLTLLSIHLWRQLDTEQHRELQTPLAKAEHDRPAPPPNVTTTTPQPEAPASVTRTFGPPDLNNEQRRRQEARKRVLDDPREHDRLKALTRQSLRAANSDLAEALQLTDAEHDALIELLAENSMQTTAMTERDPSLGYPTNDYLALRDRLMSDIADLLGPEKAQQYAAYEDAWQVRNQVQQLRGELSPADGLTEQQNRQLLTALQKERASFNEDMQRRIPSERRIGGRGLWDGAKLIADGASTLSVQEQYVRQAEEFVRRQRQRAAEVLNERQLRVFVRMQDELLARERLEARTTTLVEQGI
jgi:hypothetical protein